MKILNRLGAWALLGCGLTALTACERPPHEATQVGHRGVAMEQLVNQRIAAKVAGENVFPASILPPAEPGGQKAAEVYQNVQVLKDLNVAQFTRLMLNITAWVSRCSSRWATRQTFLATTCSSIGRTTPTSRRS